MKINNDVSIPAYRSNGQDKLEVIPLQQHKHREPDWSENMELRFKTCFIISTLLILFLEFVILMFSNGKTHLFYFIGMYEGLPEFLFIYLFSHEKKLAFNYV